MTYEPIIDLDWTVVEEATETASSWPPPQPFGACSCGNEPPVVNCC